jgi:two-component system phosphate regulon sensor histidine kinase PhoR
MKSASPFRITLIGALIVFAIVLLCASFCQFFITDLTFFEGFLIALIAAVICFVVFFILIKSYLHNQLKLIFRIIRKGKIAAREKYKPNFKKNIISEATQETERWAIERQSEIEKLKEQEAFRREFLGNLAHELKTPIFSIQGYLLTLLEGGLEDKNVNRKFLERASKATDRMTSILEDLDEITKMEVNRFELKTTHFDIVELAQEVMDALELPSSEKKIKLKFNKSYDEIFVKADRGRIAQVFTNLLTNSINYGKKGGTTHVRFYAMDKVIMTEVSDDGPGIEESVLPRLFERFYRVEQSRDRNSGGSGLGLAIVKHIIETQHKQTINVRSTVGVGSTFSFTLNKGKSPN